MGRVSRPFLPREDASFSAGVFFRTEDVPPEAFGKFFARRWSMNSCGALIDRRSDDCGPKAVAWMCSYL